MKRNRLAIFCNELASIRAITQATSRYFELTWAQDARGLQALIEQETPPTAVMVDNTSARNKAVDLLQEVRRIKPDVKRILLTDHCDLGIIVTGIHSGAVQGIVYKPISAAELLSAVGPAAMSVAMTPQINGNQPTRAAG